MVAPWTEHALDYIVFCRFDIMVPVFAGYVWNTLRWAPSKGAAIAWSAYRTLLWTPLVVGLMMPFGPYLPNIDRGLSCQSGLVCSESIEDFFTGMRTFFVMAPLFLVNPLLIAFDKGKSLAGSWPIWTARALVVAAIYVGNGFLLQFLASRL